MCCCGKPVINGEDGYSWDGKTFGVRSPMAPEIKDTDTLIYDEPGRCGGLDCHCHHFRVVKGSVGLEVLVRHGGGTDRFRLFNTMLAPLATLDSNGRFWLLHEMHWLQKEAAREAVDKERLYWRTAAAQKRIKTRKCRDRVKVWVESATGDMEARSL